MTERHLAVRYMAESQKTELTNRQNVWKPEWLQVRMSQLGEWLKGRMSHKL